MRNSAKFWALAMWLQFGASAGAGTLPSYPSRADCDAGKNAFAQTVYPKIMKDCKQCHGGNSSAPAFAVEPMAESYYRVSNQMSFPNILKSTLVFRAGNDHCSLPNCNEDSGKEMAALAQKWWDTGENGCTHFGKFHTSELTLPADLPVGGDRFVPIKWDLSSLGASFHEVFFSLEAQVFAKPTTQTPGAYRFRKPRIAAGDKVIKIRDIKLLLNRRYDPAANNFTVVDKIVSPPDAKAPGRNYAVLSSDTVILIQELAEGDKLSLSFEELTAWFADECKDLTTFEDQLSPQFGPSGCFACHRAEGGPLAAKEAFSMEGSAKALCRGVKERSILGIPEYLTSPIVTYPIDGKFGHPKIAESRDYLDALKTWLAGEGARTLR